MTKRKAHILDVAEKLFAEHGFDGTTTRLISETAEANIAMISYYFGGKEKLLKAILDRFAEDLYTLIKNVQDVESDPKERLKKWIISYTDYAFDHPDPVIVAHRQVSILRNKPEIFSSTRTAFNKIFELIYLTLEQGQQDGFFRKFDIELMIITLKATINDLVLESSVIKEDFKIETGGDDKIYSDQFRARVKKHLMSLVGSFTIEDH